LCAERGAACGTSVVAAVRHTRASITCVSTVGSAGRCGLSVIAVGGAVRSSSVVVAVRSTGNGVTIVEAASGADRSVTVIEAATDAGRSRTRTIAVGSACRQVSRDEREQEAGNQNKTLEHDYCRKVEVVKVNSLIFVNGSGKLESQGEVNQTQKLGFYTRRDRERTPLSQDTTFTGHHFHVFSLEEVHFEFLLGFFGE